jgi:hypothetical protein
MRRGDRFQADFYYALPKAEGLRLMPGLEWLQAQKPLLAQPWALQPADLPPLP